MQYQWHGLIRQGLRKDRPAAAGAVALRPDRRHHVPALPESRPMPVPDYETLMLPVLRAFAGGAQTVRDCLPALRRAFEISEAEAAELQPSGGKTVLADRTHWARTYMSKAGLLSSPKRGAHVLTDRGRALLAEAPGRIDNVLLRSRYPEFAEWLTAARRGNGESPGPGFQHGDPSARQPTPLPLAETPEERIERASAELDAALADDLLDRLRTMDALRYERLELDLLTAMGYGTGSYGSRSLTPASGDGGIDGIIHEDALGLDAVYVQAKRYRAETKVGRPAIQQFVGSLTGEGATKGVFVTTSGFSAEARDYLRRVSHRIVLIDGPELARLMIRHGVGVRVRQTVAIKSVDADYFGDLDH
jgi:restriction system protein